MEVFRQSVRRTHHPQVGLATGVVRRRLCRSCPLTIIRSPMGVELAIDRPELLPDISVVNQQEPPSLGVSCARDPHSSIQYPSLNALGDRLICDPSHGAGRVKGFSQVHASNVITWTRPGRVGTPRYLGVVAKAMSCPSRASIASGAICFGGLR